MWSASTEPGPPEQLRPPRPGAVLVIAGAVPIGVAILLTAGLVPWGARIALGVAVVALGLRVRGLEGTRPGYRLGGPVVRASGEAAILLGGLLVAGAAVAGADGGHLDALDAGTAVPVLGGPEGVLLGALVLGVGVLVRRAAPGGGTAASDVGPATAAVGAAIAVVSALGRGVLGVDGGAWQIAVLVLAAVGAGVALRGPRRPAARAAGVGAAVLLVLSAGDASGTGSAVVGLLVQPAVGSVSEGAAAFVLVATAAVPAVLLADAVRRGDVVVGAPAAAVLLSWRPVEAGVGRPAAFVVPVLVLLLSVLGARGRGPVPRHAAPVVGSAAVVVGLVAAYGALHGLPDGVLLDYDDYRATHHGLMRFAVVATVLLAGLVLAARTAGVRRRPPLVVVVLLGLAAVQPLLLFAQAAPATVLGGPLSTSLLGALTIGAGAVVARSCPTRGVLAALGLLGAVSVAGVGFGIADRASPDDATLLVLSTFGPVALATVVLAGLALAGDARRAPGAQAAAAGLTYGAALTALGAAGSLVATLDGSAGSAPPVLHDGGAAVAVLLAMGLLLGVALLAASAVRRPSRGVAAVVVVAVASWAVVVAALAAAVAGGPVGEDRGQGPELLDVALGFRAVGGPLDLARGGWPVLLAVLGVVLLGAGAWLESRRPLPADAPIG